MSRIWLGGILASPSWTIFLTKEAARHHRLAVTNRFSLGGALGENPTVRPGAITDGQFRASASSDSIASDCVVRTARETKFYLYESILKTGGAEYKKLQTYSFVKETREA